MKKPRRKYHVRGNGWFPIDMLRYDSSWPASELDSNIVNRAQSGERYDVYLLTDNQSGPTVERWRSFGWDVVSVEKVT